MSFPDAITAHFPNARPVPAARQWLVDWLTSECGGTLESTLLATSFCADDIIASKDFGRLFWGPFTLGGLGGLPFAGLTGMSAFAHHIPDDGTALILYGPHIGIGRDGTPGRLLRPGQSQETTSCGSLMAALSQLRAGPPTTGVDSRLPVDDLEQAELVKLLSPHRERIIEAAVPECEITNVAYRLVHDRIQRLISALRDQFHGARIAWVGGIVINTSPDEDDWFDVRDAAHFAG